MSTSLSSNRSVPARVTPAAAAAAVSPAKLLSPQPLLTSIRPGVLAPIGPVACAISRLSTSTSTAETRKQKLGLAPLRVMLVAAAHTPMNGTLAAFTMGTMAWLTGLSMPPNRAATPSRSISSRAAAWPLAGLLSSSRRTSARGRPSTPPRALTSLSATVRPRVMPSPDLADWPERAATRPSLTGSAARARVAWAMMAVAASSPAWRREREAVMGRLRCDAGGTMQVACCPLQAPR